jgi:hypothetical protein
VQLHADVLTHYPERLAMPVFPTLLVARRPRKIGVDWMGARSHFGGAPRLGTTPWPRDNKREPLHFVAQLDLAELAATTGATPLADKGSLAFFIGQQGSVIFVPEGQSATPVLPPSDMSGLDKFGGSSDWLSDLERRPLFPFWPIDFSVLDIGSMAADFENNEAHMAYERAKVAAVERHLPLREYHLSPEAAFAGPPIPDWWQNGIHLAALLTENVKSGNGAIAHAQRRLEEARSTGGQPLSDTDASVAYFEAFIARQDVKFPVFEAFVAEVNAWTAGRDPWALMTANDTALLGSYWKRNTEFPDLTGFTGIGELEWLKDIMYKALPASDSAAFAAFPGPVRDLLNAKRQPRMHWWYMAHHFTNSLQSAAGQDLQNVAKYQRGELAAYRKRLTALSLKGARTIFQRSPVMSNDSAAKLVAEIATLEAKFEELARSEPLFHAFVRETVVWTAGRDPWSLMTEAEVAELNARMTRADKEFHDFVSMRVARRLYDLETTALKAILTGPDRAYATLPEAVREKINSEYLLPPGKNWHQMFGFGIDIQGGSGDMYGEGYIMLLQLTYDDLMHFTFGDAGCYQFWISPADLAKRNWAAVQMTFECH